MFEGSDSISIVWICFCVTNVSQSCSQDYSAPGNSSFVGPYSNTSKKPDCPAVQQGSEIWARWSVQRCLSMSFFLLQPEMPVGWDWCGDSSQTFLQANLATTKYILELGSIKPLFVSSCWVRKPTARIQKIQETSISQQSCIFCCLPKRDEIWNGCDSTNGWHWRPIKLQPLTELYIRRPGSAWFTVYVYFMQNPIFWQNGPVWGCHINNGDHTNPKFKTPNPKSKIKLQSPNFGFWILDAPSTWNWGPTWRVSKAIGRGLFDSLLVDECFRKSAPISESGHFGNFNTGNWRQVIGEARPWDKGKKI